ncbi:MAG TPA: 16S rRNA (guanine(527)-N(7))-methyltransferase RsmG [Actinomycetota bacterium]|nr:16S rRNA (guanine(527)-N(7))-methyltransferase RsmG [Actinomycetota bacterium]
MKRGSAPADGLSPDQVELLRGFERLLLDRALPAGFVSDTDSARLFERHVLDSLRAVACLTSGDRDLMDLGSGAGLPGVPIAIARPDVKVRLLEAGSRRAAFLEMVVLELGLSNVVVEVGRVEDSASRADVCTARAFADAGRAWALARRVLHPAGRMLYFAGRSWRDHGGALEGLQGADVTICEQGGFSGDGPIVIIREVPPAR